MPIDYLLARVDGAHLYIDTFSERIVLLAEDYDGDPGDADEGDDGVVAIYSLDPDALLMAVLDELAQAGVNVDAMLRRTGDGSGPLLPGLRYDDQPDGEE